MDLSHLRLELRVVVRVRWLPYRVTTILRFHCIIIIKLISPISKVIDETNNMNHDLIFI